MGRKHGYVVGACIAAFVLTGFVGQNDGFARERGGKNDTLKNSLEGKAAPALQIEEWMNIDGKAKTLKDFKGKVVLLDFWAHW